MPGYEAAQRVAREAPTARDRRHRQRRMGGRRPRVRVRPRRQALSLRRSHSGRVVGGRRQPDRCGRRAARTRPRRRRRRNAADSSSRRCRRTDARKRSTRIATSGSAAPTTATRAPITTDGSVAGRIKYGTASWVYGEELSQRTAMWWSPDGRKLAYYRFDEREVHDYYVVMNQTRLQAALDTEAFPTAGTPNPDRRSVRLRRRQPHRRRASTCAAASRSTTPPSATTSTASQWSRRRPRAAVPPHQPPAERHGGRGGEPGDRRVPRRAARRVADRLAGGRAAHGVSRRRPALHLGVAAQRLEQLLSLRSERHG